MTFFYTITNIKVNPYALLLNNSSQFSGKPMCFIFINSIYSSINTFKSVTVLNQFSGDGYNTFST